MKVFIKKILFFGNECLLICDGKCHKAFGLNNRPRINYDKDNPDDYAFLPDKGVDEAPDDPGTYEGGHSKPPNPDYMNKWCARACERGRIVNIPQRNRIVSFDLPTFNKLRYNIPSKHEGEEMDNE